MKHQTHSAIQLLRGRSLLALLVASTIAVAPAAAMATPRDQMRTDFDQAVKGKTVAWVPITLGNPIGDMWTAAMRQNFEKYGIKFVVRDPNFSTSAQLQAVTNLINQKPDVLIVQNANVTLLTKELKRAMDNGIYVVQVNLLSNQATDAYVGVDYVDVGRQIARDIVKECGGGKSSGKVAFVQGEATATDSIDQLKGIMEVFKQDKSIKLVSTQSAKWDSNLANQITATTLQQHPDLCATYGSWGIMQQGAAQAVKTAGLQGKVKVYASSDGPRSDCDLVEQKLFHKILSFRADIQGEQVSNAVISLLQSGKKPGGKQMTLLSNNYWVSGKQERNYCYDLPK